MNSVLVRWKCKRFLEKKVLITEVLEEFKNANMFFFYRIDFFYDKMKQV
ncbi:hypothetical protein HMPREF1992_02000 [Selenomonas sp. oral taxon 892 str. F0426]|nr:hypothetical protein HMPREF1992_02000 [Selenomonas sp. oral taxon 892 str. F0426]